MKKTVLASMLSIAATTAYANETTINSHALFSLSGQEMMFCASDITTNYGFTAAILEPVEEKAKRDIYRTFNQCISDTQRENILKKLVTVGGAALLYKGCEKSECTPQDYENVAEVLVKSQEHIIEILSNRTLTSLKGNCSETQSVDCINSAISKVDYSVTLDDLEWATLREEDRILEIKNPDLEEIRKHIQNTGNYLQAISDALRANLTGTQVFMAVDKTLVPTIKDDLPEEIKVLPNNQIMLPMFPNPLHLRGQGYQFKLVTEVSIKECGELMKNVQHLQATSIFVNQTSAPTSPQSNISAYCGPNQENTLTLIY